MTALPGDSPHHVRYPDSGIRENFSSAIGNPELWNPECNERFESGIQYPLVKTGNKYLSSGIHKVESRTQDCLELTYHGELVNVCWLFIVLEHYSLRK